MKMVRGRGGRLMRAVAVLLGAAGVIFTTAASGGTTSIAAKGQPLPALTAGALSLRYAANQETITKDAQTAERDENHTLSVRLTAMSRPGRQFLMFDSDGLAAEVIGNLATARRVAIVVPGANTTLDTFDSLTPGVPWSAPSPGGAARAVSAEAQALKPHNHLAVIAWLGYQTPDLVSLDAAAVGRADDGAQALRPLVQRLAARGTQVALLCHSYGTVVCGRAASHLPVTDIAVVGSPGMTVSSVQALHTHARVWAGRGANDWIQYVPHIRVLGVGLGIDPTSTDFGARRFATGNGGHSDYFTPDSTSLRNLTYIALGLPQNVTPA